VYLAFGHDEEVGGRLGAKAIAELLQSRGVVLEFVLDEGGPLLVDGLQPFVQKAAVALVGTAEKVPRRQLLAPGTPIHMPPAQSPRAHPVICFGKCVRQLCQRW
jgi:carboxypeptidase PM20D1